MLIRFTLIIFLFLNQFAWAETFEQWKVRYSNRAQRRGLEKNFVLKVLSDVEEDPEVVKKDRNQIILNEEIDYKAFIKRWLRENPSRIEKGRAVLKENEKLLTEIEKKYGVEKEIIVSLWGVETFYGEITGDYDLVRSLATLAYEGRRRNFFEIQLNASLRLLKHGDVTREKLKGSWAGATGQCQFMPSNIPAHGQDYDKDGKMDIWSNKADIFASIANFLKKAGWKKGKSIGSLALNTEGKKLSPRRYRSQAEYNRLGFRNLDGSKIKDHSWRKRKIVEIPMKNSPVILRGGNYTPLLTWNNSSLFAAFNIIMVEGLKNKPL